MPFGSILGWTSHPYARNLPNRHRLSVWDSEELSNAVDRCIAVGFGFLRKELSGLHCAIGTVGHDISKGAAPVDLELPFGFTRRLNH
jgi:hypothetical protein